MNVAEEAFYSHLTDAESVEYLIREGFSDDLTRQVIPEEVGRRLVEWVIDYYMKSGRTVAPSREAIMETWEDLLSPLEIEIRDDVEQDSIQWAVEQLRTRFVDYTFGEFSKQAAVEIRAADPQKRPFALQEQSQLLHFLAQTVLSRREEMRGSEGISDAIHRYEKRASEGHVLDGITLGLPEIDNHMLGVHPGEIGIFAGTSGGGKSWVSLMALESDWERNRRTMLFTLENDIEMTYDRLACVHCKVPYDKWQRGECGEGEVVRVKEYAEQLKERDNFIIAHPKMGEATGVSMIRRAVIEDVDSVIIDQLSHIEPVPGSRARERNQVVAEIVRDLRRQIQEVDLPLLLLHQINRKGREEARKVGHYLMDHMGEATQVENGASWIAAVYQSPDHVIGEWAEIQELKFSRGICKKWEVEWRPYVGDVRVRKEISDDDV